MEAVVYNCFLRKLVQLRHTDVTSFSMQFEKEDVDNWGKLSRVRVVCWLKARRGKRIFSGLILSLCPPCFQPTNDSPLLRKASHTNQLPLFSNCMQNDVTLVQCCMTSFRKKTNCILLKHFVLIIFLLSKSKYFLSIKSFLFDLHFSHVN